MSGNRLARHFSAMARANRLANHRLHGACLRLAPGEWTATRTGFFPSIAATLNHILVVDWFYLDALEGGGVGNAVFRDEMPCATMADLAARQCDADLRLLAFCERFEAEGDDALARPVAFDRGVRGIVHDRVDRTLPHCFMHQHHHRGQAHAMLSGTSVKPPQLDEFIMATDDVFRVEDLKAVGMTEADLAR